MNWPSPIVLGEMPVTTGMGFSTVTLLDACAEGLAWLVACTVTIFGLGSVAGGVKEPEAEIVPIVAFPPAIPFTDQVTAVFVVPVTESENCWAGSPRRTVIVVGVTETVTEFVGLVLLPPPPDAQPASNATKAHQSSGTKAKTRLCL
jgi:hypothetical protein